MMGQECQVVAHMLFAPTQLVYYQTQVHQDFMEETQVLEGENSDLQDAPPKMNSRRVDSFRIETICSSVTRFPRIGNLLG